jgi:hypothetical protein
MIVVNFSTKEYLNGQKRLAASLNGHKYLMFDSYEAIGSPTHQQSPYEFKLHAIEKAFGFDPIVLWADSSVFRVGDLSIIENIIKNEGFFGEESGHYCYDWANDNCRKYHNLKKEEGLIMYSAGLTGLNRDNPLAMEFFNQWLASAKAGCFVGDYVNHRHDMVNASIIAQRLGLKFQKGGTYLSYLGSGYNTPSETSIFHLQGMV